MSAIGEAIRSFATVFPAELPDKTMIATIVLVTRYRRALWVWVGAVLAFTIHVVVAVGAGSAIGLLPDTLVKVVVAALFATGSVLLVRAARQAEDDDLEPDEEEVSATIRATVIPTTSAPRCSPPSRSGPWPS